MKIRSFIYLLIIKSFLSANLSAVSLEQETLNKNLEIVNTMDNKTKKEFIKTLNKDVSGLLLKKYKNKLHKSSIQKYKKKYNLTNHINEEILCNILYILTEENYEKEKNERESYEKIIAEQEQEEENEAANLIISLSKRKYKIDEIDLTSAKKQKPNDDSIEIIEDKQEINNIKIKAKEKQIENIITDINPSINSQDKNNIIKIITEINNLNTIIEIEHKKQIIIFFKKPFAIKTKREKKIQQGFSFVIQSPQSITENMLKNKINITWDEEQLYNFAIQYQPIFEKLLQ
jgi:hypothetical protein